MSPRQPEELLFHYTSFEAALSILRTSSFWFTDARFLNDRSEQLHGYELFYNELSKQPPGQPADLSWLADVCKEGTYYVRVFTTCFCGVGDLLSQWRGYGGSAGVALGFDKATLETAIWSVIAGHEERHDLPVTLERVQYDLELKKMVVETLVNDFASNTTSHDDLIPKLLRQVASMKDPSFKEETEWRLVHIDTSDFDLEERKLLSFRTARGHLVPYLNARISGGLPLKTVLLGPHSTPGLAETSMKSALRTLGYGDTVSVTQSKVPYR